MIDELAYLDGVGFPASRDDLLAAAQQEGAPRSVVAAFRDLPSRRFSDRHELRLVLAGYPLDDEVTGSEN